MRARARPRGTQAAHCTTALTLQTQRAGAECCDAGFYLVDGEGCPGTAAIQSNECTGSNVCCSELADGQAHDPEHEREAADEEMGTLDLREEDRGDHGRVEKSGGEKRSSGGGKKRTGGGKRRFGSNGLRRNGGGKGGKGGASRSFFSRMRARLLRRRRADRRRRNSRNGKHY